MITEMADSISNSETEETERNRELVRESAPPTGLEVAELATGAAENPVKDAHPIAMNHSQALPLPSLLCRNSEVCSRLENFGKLADSQDLPVFPDSQLDSFEAGCEPARLTSLTVNLSLPNRRL